MTTEAEALWTRLAPDRDGLITAVVQHARSGEVLMVGHMSHEALTATLRSRRVTFFSRSRRRLWEKGESSGHALELVELRADCDGDAVLVQAIPRGPTCHTGKPSCFFRPFCLTEDLEFAAEDQGPKGFRVAVLSQVFETILARKAGEGFTNAAGKSYVRALLDGGVPSVIGKIDEEARELARAIAEESTERVAAEAADLVFHVLVGLASREVTLDDVADVLAARHGTSGVDEKTARRETHDGG